MTTPLAQSMNFLPVRMAGRLVQFQWQILLLPWNVVLFCLSTSAGFLLRFLVLAGAPPSGYTDQATLQKMRSIIEHMHSREDQYRRKIKEQQEQSEAVSREKRKVVAKLQKLKSEILMYQQEQTSKESGRRQIVATKPSWQVHIAVLGATALTFWLLSAPWVPSISKKVVNCLAWPLVLSWLWRLPQARKPGFLHAATHSLAFFLIGYISCHWINAAG